MAVTTNQFDVRNTSFSTAPPTYCFAATQHDTNYLSDPNIADKPIISRGVSMSAEGALKVEFANGETATIPAGHLAAGVIHPMAIVRVFDTGTDAQTIHIWV